MFWDSAFPSGFYLECTVVSVCVCPSTVRATSLPETVAAQLSSTEVCSASLLLKLNLFSKESCDPHRLLSFLFSSSSSWSVHSVQGFA